jgi:hypothetical protein
MSGESGTAMHPSTAPPEMHPVGCTHRMHQSRVCRSRDKRRQGGVGVGLNVNCVFWRGWDGGGGDSGYSHVTKMCVSGFDAEIPSKIINLPEVRLNL